MGFKVSFPIKSIDLLYRTRYIAGRARLSSIRGALLWVCVGAQFMELAPLLFSSQGKNTPTQISNPPQCVRPWASNEAVFPLAYDEIQNLHTPRYITVKAK